MTRRDIFVESDTDKDNILTLNEVAAAFQKLQSKITSYPAVRPLPPHLTSPHAEREKLISDGPSCSSTR